MNNEKWFPKSLKSNKTSYVRFFNISHRLVDIIWINFDGIGLVFKQLDHQQYCDINTFVNHIWVFRDSIYHDRMNVYYQSSKYSRSFFISDEECFKDIRKWVFIKLPVFSLKKLVFQILRKYKINLEKLNNLEIPLTIKQEYFNFLSNPNI